MSDKRYTTLDEAKAYARGYARAQRNHDRANRVAAFGAIRRAAEVARKYDRWASEERNEDEEYWVFMDMAYGVRRAIRAAIGGPKV